MKNSVQFNWRLALLPMHLVVVISSVILDQITKYLVIFNMQLGERIPLLPVLDLVHIKNRGAAFGIFHDASPWFRLIFFGVVTIVCVYLLVYWLGTTPKEDRWQRFALALILGGALGNLKDRVFFGQVTDFVRVYYQDWSWPAFNVADSAISVGVVIIILRLLPIKSMLRGHPKESKT